MRVSKDEGVLTHASPKRGHPRDCPEGLGSQAEGKQRRIPQQPPIRILGTGPRMTAVHAAQPRRIRRLRCWMAVPRPAALQRSPRPRLGGWTSTPIHPL